MVQSTLSPHSLSSKKILYCPFKEVFQSAITIQVFVQLERRFLCVFTLLSNSKVQPLVMFFLPEKCPESCQQISIKKETVSRDFVSQ